jgi:hypothetical protein
MAEFRDLLGPAMKVSPQDLGQGSHRLVAPRHDGLKQRGLGPLARLDHLIHQVFRRVAHRPSLSGKWGRAPSHDPEF